MYKNMEKEVPLEGQEYVHARGYMDVDLEGNINVREEGGKRV